MSEFNRERMMLLVWICAYSASVYFFVEAHWTVQVALAFGFAWQLVSGYGGKGQLTNILEELECRRVDDFNRIVSTVTGLKKEITKLQEQQTALENKVRER